jgi:MoxR-like ATPase
VPTLYDRPFVCPRLVGREAQVATIGRLLDEAAARRGRVLLVAGEAGVGKSRLVAEARVLVGFHFRFACEAGVQVGRKIGKYAIGHSLRALR